MPQDVVGSRKGDYEILALLGVGGMGQVYKVRNVLSDRVEAMKVLLPNLADQKMLADRFIREIKVLANLHHRNIAELRTALTIDNQLVMIMEFVEGTTLAARVQEGGIPYGQALGYIQQVLAALSYAHSQKIIHRDIKPSNMMLTPSGVVKLMDFGIARQDGDVALTMTNSTVGSIAYMSPEQVKGEPADARSDLYSVGVSLYELVTGQRPFQGDTGFSIMRAHLETMPKPPIEVRPDLPVAISDLILMAVAKDPAKRFQSADAFSRAIGSVMPVIQGTAPGVPAVSSAAPISPSPISATIAGDSASPFQATQIAPPSPRPTPQPAAAAPRIAAAPVQALAAKSPPANNYRGFYIALGAMIVLVALAAAGFYVPRHMKTQAAQQSASSSADASASPAPTPSSTPDASATAARPAPAADTSSSSAAPTAASTGAPPNGDTTATTAGAPAKNTSGSSTGGNEVGHVYVPPRQGASQGSSQSDNQSMGIYVPPRNAGASGSGPAERSAAPSPSPGSSGAAATSSASAEAAGNATMKPSAPADAAALQETEKSVDQLSGRAGAVTASLNSLRQQQSAQGLGLRGDMVAAEQRMETNMNKAQAAVQAGDAAQAKHYLDLAEPDVEKLEHFLGH
jgi:serine/threonine protein kinase